LEKERKERGKEKVKGQRSFHSLPKIINNKEVLKFRGF